MARAAETHGSVKRPASLLQIEVTEFVPQSAVLERIYVDFAPVRTDVTDKLWRIIGQTTPQGEHCLCRMLELVPL